VLSDTPVSFCARDSGVEWNQCREPMKRFTQTTKWDDPWFWELSPKAKLLWVFICDHCDYAGIIEISLRIASAKIGDEVTHEHLSELLVKLRELSPGKYLIPGFIKFQYGQLSPDCKPHLPVYQSLEKHRLCPVTLQSLSEALAKAPLELQEKER